MQSDGSVVSWVVVLMAASSLLSMICLFQVDTLVHNDFYRYGLQFGYNWATPYLSMTKIAFVMGWLNIVAAIVVQLYSVVFGRKEVDQLLLEAGKARERALEILKTESTQSEEIVEHKEQESERPAESEIEQKEQKETWQEPPEKSEEPPIQPDVPQEEPLPLIEEAQQQTATAVL